MVIALFRILQVLAPFAVWMALLVPVAVAAAAEHEVTGREIFLQNCALCHVTGVAMAPRMDSRADWEPRLAVGRPSLLNSVLRGKGGMPPKGGNASITDAQAAAALDYIVGRVLGSEDEAQFAKYR